MSHLRTDLISNKLGTGPVEFTKQKSQKAYANLNGIGTIALRESFNISSAIDNAVGDASFNFTSLMTNGNYVITGSAGPTPADVTLMTISMSNTSYRTYTARGNSSAADMTFHLNSVVGNLA